MPTVSDINAQTGFNNIRADFATVASDDFSGGKGIIEILRAIVESAIAKVETQTDPLGTSFSAEEIAALSPLLGAGGFDVLRDRVTKEIESGDYGLDQSVEDQIFERSRERETRVLASAEDAANRLFSSGGFTQPTGAQAAAIAAVQAEARDRIISANREQTMKHADLYLAAKKDAVAAGLGLMERFAALLKLKVDEFTAAVQAQTTLATAGMSGLNVNFGLSVGANASISGSESTSESEDKSADVVRKSESQSWDRTKGDETHDYVDYHYTNET